MLARWIAPVALSLLLLPDAGSAAAPRLSASVPMMTLPSLNLPQVIQPVGPRRGLAPRLRLTTPHKAGLGVVLQSASGGQIFGFDIDQSGDDGVFATAQTVSSGGAALTDVETFDQNSGAISKVFAQYEGTKKEYAMNGIFAGDVALITKYEQIKQTIYYRRAYEVMNPVTAQKFTGKWNSPISDLLLSSYAENQTTPTSVIFGYTYKKNQSLPTPYLIATDIATGQSKKFKLDENLFGGADGPIVGQYTAANQGVLALSPDAGAVGGKPPVNVLIDLNSGAETSFNGLNNGYYHAGSVNGLAVDPNTGIAATDTELNAQVEFYNLSTQAATAVQLPCTGSTDQLSSGSGIAVDPINKLFLVTEKYYGCNSGTSALMVYDESGNLQETITGFGFAIGEPAPVINPSKRMGWAFGPAFSQLQQFFY